MGEESVFPRAYSYALSEYTPFYARRKADQYEQYWFGLAPGSLTNQSVIFEPSVRPGWVGFFPELGGASCLDREAVRSWLDPNFALVLCGHDGAYLINTAAPDDFTKVQIGTVKQVYPIPDQGRVAFVSYSDMAMYDRDGLVWRTPSVALDSLRVTGHEVGALLCTADLPLEDRVPFSIEIETGVVVGERVVEFMRWREE